MSSTTPQTNHITSYHTYLNYRNQEYLQENDKEILTAVEQRDKGLLDRINNFRTEKMTEQERLKISIDDILSSIKSDIFIRAHFRKDPTRQSIHENTQIEWIKLHQYPDAYKLPAAKGGTYFCKNKLQSIHPRPTDATKTLDLHVPSKKVYGVLKYSTTEGGAQDNQFRDVKHFIQQMNGYLTENPTAEESFVFYLDGPYYTAKKYKELNDMILFKEKIIITCVYNILPLPPLTKV
jgi:hypothetical protein